jgi:ferredoxin
MKISIDKSKCQAQKRCFNLYPELFEESPDGDGRVRDGSETVSEENEIDAQSAANACPQAAIVIEY